MIIDRWHRDLEQFRDQGLAQPEGFIGEAALDPCPAVLGPVQDDFSLGGIGYSGMTGSFSTRFSRFPARLAGGRYSNFFSPGFLANGNPHIFVELDGPAVDLAAHCLRHIRSSAKQR
jgi:hypothetical protein